MCNASQSSSRGSRTSPVMSRTQSPYKNNAVRNGQDDILTDTIILHHHEKHYYPDGNIVLVAETTKFRVFRSILAGKSEVFKDMFDMTSPGLESNMLNFVDGAAVDDGVPMIELQDSAQDVERLLDAVFPSSMFAPRPSVDVIYSILRLSEKYEFDVVYKETALAAFHPFPRGLKDFREDPDLTCYKDVIKAAGVIRLARVTGDISVLPLAFYALAIRDWRVNDVQFDEEISRSMMTSDHARLQKAKQALLLQILENLVVLGREGKGCNSVQDADGLNRTCLSEVEGLFPMHTLPLFLKDPLSEILKKASAPKYTYCNRCVDHLESEMPRTWNSLFDTFTRHCTE